MTTEKGFNATLEGLRNTLGEIAVYDEPEVPVLTVDTAKEDPEFDRQGLHALMSFGRKP